MPGNATATRSSFSRGGTSRSMLSNRPPAISARTFIAQPSGSNADAKWTAILFPAPEVIAAVLDELLARLGELEDLDELVGRDHLVALARLPLIARVRSEEHT